MTDRPSTLGEFLMFTAETHGSLPYVSYGGNVLSSREIADMSMALANSIRNRYPGKRGDRVLVILPLSAHMYVTYHALWLLGMIPVPVSMELPSSSISSLLKNGNISGMISFPETYEKLDEESKQGIFHIAAGPADFTSTLSRAPAEVRSLTGRGRKKYAMEEMCYGEGYMERDMDPFSDMGMCGISWNRDGTFKINEFSINSIMEALYRIGEVLPERPELPFFQTYDPISPAEVVLSILYPALRGHNCIPARLDSMLPAIMKEQCRTDPGVFNTRTDAAIVWGIVGKSFGDKISHIIEDWNSPDGYNSVPEVRRSSIFTLHCVDNDVSPQYLLQRRKGSRSIPTTGEDDGAAMQTDSAPVDVVDLDGVVEYCGKTIPWETLVNSINTGRKGFMLILKDGKITGRGIAKEKILESLPIWMRKAVY